MPASSSSARSRASVLPPYRTSAFLRGTRDVGGDVCDSRHGLLGIRTLILTNAAGGINLNFKPGTLMVIDDHINLMGTNPLVGSNDDRFGPRFPDMTEAYSKRLREIADQAAAARGVSIAHGVYVALHGPSYETPAEIRYLRTIGADAVGMSTVPETIVARHMGMEVLGISCITNPAAGVLPKPLVHDEVMEVARRVRGEFSSCWRPSLSESDKRTNRMPEKKADRRSGADRRTISTVGRLEKPHPARGSAEWQRSP
jgi:hypothetical protein